MPRPSSLPPRATPPAPTAAELRRAVGMFVLTWLSVYWTYGTTWAGGGMLSPFTDPEIASQSAQFAVALMTIFLAHELGHYLVARRHGMEQTLPLFLPFPMAFGTLGAIIRLRTLPPSRSALLEMGAAGPLAGFVVALVVMAIGLPGTEDAATPVITMAWPPPPPSGIWTLLAPVFEVLDGLLSAVWTPPPVPDGPVTLPLTIMANPPIMDLMGTVLLGAPPGRYASLSPLGFAAWAGCFLTAMNLLPIGQLDGGHVTNALAPTHARRLSLVALGLTFAGGFLTWPGWAFWSVLLFFLGATRSLPVHPTPPLTLRARLTAAAALVAFVSCFMPVPIDMEEVPLDQLDLRDEDGRPITADDIRAWRTEAAGGAGDDTSSTGREID